ncbi:MAG: MATE family efflux transporter [Sphaerochaetaceae bacterium]|nr:MATE family efflux transporter [Sphaerochaetaceae bacterium]
MDKQLELQTKPIGSLILQYSIPAVIAMIVNAIYNIVDRIFIGKFAGESALASLTIDFPLMLILFSFATLIGAGGAALFSIKLGEKDIRAANLYFANTVSSGILVSTVMILTVFFNLEPILYLLGATETLIVQSSAYMRIILTGFIFQSISLVLNNMVRNEGNPLLSMIAMLSSAVINIALDFVFIGLMDMGVEGAALATIIGQFSGFCLLASFYLRKKSVISVTWKDFLIQPKIFGKIVLIGFPTFIGTIGTSLSMTFLNRGLSIYGGVAAITAMGAINSLYTFFIMPMMGIQQGVQPIMGYNYGAEEFGRVSKTLRYSIFGTILFSSVVFLLLYIFPNTAVSLFLSEGSATVDVAVEGLRYYILMLPLLGVNLLSIAYFQSTAKGRIAIILGLLRQFIFLIPLVLILPLHFDLTGVWIATPIADALAIAVSLAVLAVSARRNLKRTEVSAEISPAVHEA